MKFFERIKRLLIVWIWNHTPNCAEMSRLASKGIDQPLSLRIRLRMRLHYLICVWCKRYFKQLRFLHEAAPRFDEHAGTLPTHSLSVEARRRIVQRLRGVENKEV
jgi:hypothetical protein